MVYTLPGGEAVLRTLPADAAIRNLPVAPRPPLPTAPLPRVPLPAVGGGAAAAGGGAAGGAAATGSAAATAGAIAAGVLAFGAGFAVGDAVAQSLGIEYPGGKNALQYFFGAKDPGIGATGAVNAPTPTLVEGDPPFTGGQSGGVLYNISYQLNGNQATGIIPSSLTYGPIEGLTRQEVPGPGPNGQPYGVTYPGTARHSGGTPFQIFLNLNGTTGRWVDPSRNQPEPVITGLTITRADGQPDTGGDPSGSPEPGTLPRRTGAALAPATTAPATAPAPTTTPTAPPAPATPGDPVNPPKERDPLLPPWLDPLTAIGIAVGAAAGLAGSPAAGPKTTPVNNPSPGAGGDDAPPPTKTKTDNACRCNIPLMNKLDALDNKIERTLGGASLAGEGGILAYLQKMQTFAEKAWKATQMQKVLDVLTFIGVMHNVSMLSRNVGETFLEVVGQGLQAVGIRDEENNVIDVNEVVGENVEGLLKNILGVERYNGLNEAFNKANRIISTASSVIWTVRSIADSSQDLMEWIGENTGRIGNALKRWRVVGENAYPDMSESAKAQHRMRTRFSKAGEFLENTEDRISVFGQATSGVIEIQQETNELAENFGAFKKSVEEGVPDPWADNLPVKAVNDQDKADSLAPEINVSDSQQG